MKKQVNKTHYDFNNYADNSRFNSYYYQVREALKCHGKNILYIGIGDGIVIDILKKYGKNVDTFDFAKDLNPNIYGSIEDIDKLLTKKYDIIICCQVLEHIPYNMVEDILIKLSKCYKEKIILSLPNCNFWIKFELTLPKLPHIRFKIPIKRFIRYRKWDINIYGNGEHYYELDAKGYETKKFIKLLKKYYHLNNFFVPYENTYHTFFILDNLYEKR